MSSWKNVVLGEVCEVLDNLRKPITKRNRVEGEYPYYGATGILSYVHNYIFSEKLVLIGEDGAKWRSGDNTSFITEGKYWVNNHAHVIRPNRKIILDEWIVYFLNFSDLTPFISGMTVPKLNQERMRNIPIPLPPLPEQKRIVAKLDEAFMAITKAKANAEQNIKNAREVFESYLQLIMDNGKNGGGWEVRKLGEVYKTSSGGTPLKNKKEYYDNGKIPWLRSGEVCNDYINNSELFITEEGFKNSSAKFFPKNSVLIALYGATAGQVGILNFECTTNQAICGIFPNENYLPKFLLYILKSKNKLIVSQTYGTAQPNLSQVIIKNLTIPLPPLTPRTKTHCSKIRCTQSRDQKA